MVFRKHCSARYFASLFSTSGLAEISRAVSQVDLNLQAYDQATPWAGAIYLSADSTQGPTGFGAELALRDLEQPST